ncbi:hypothetical protein FRB99_001354 [Tulasnella sp. 403]|nr:hypothetical protein FRB99_001354 [Tulasnella sp. 403]
MTPKWFRFVLSWLSRHRERKSSEQPTLRRRASFPVYQQPRQLHVSANQQPAYLPLNSGPANTGSLRGLPLQTVPVQLPQGYVYQTAQGWVGNNRVTVSASAYPAHFTPAAAPYNSRGQHAGQSGYVPVAQPAAHQQYYVFPQQGMTQVLSAPATVAHRSKKATPVVVPPPPKAPVQSSKPPPPPPPQRRSARVARANSAPANSQPYNASPRRVADAFARYSGFFSQTYAPRKITFHSIPWPMVDPPKHPTSLTVNAVRSFLLSPHHSQNIPAKERIEAAQRVWDLQTFMATFGPRIRKEDRDQIERALAFLKGTLRLLHSEAVTAAESLNGRSS